MVTKKCLQPPKALILSQTILKLDLAAPKPLYILIFLMSFSNHPYATCMPFVCQSYVLVCHSYIILLSLAWLVCHSYVIPYVRKSHVCTRMPFVCHSYVLECHSYATRMHLYVIRMSLVCGFTMNPSSLRKMFSNHVKLHNDGYLKQIK